MPKVVRLTVTCMNIMTMSTATVITAMITVTTMLITTMLTMIMPIMIINTVTRMIIPTITATMITRMTGVVMMDTVMTNKVMINKVMAAPVTPTSTNMAFDGARSFAAVLSPESEASSDPDATLFRLLTWLSPAFPVGAFSYSSGIEWAVEAGDIRDAASLQDWLGSLLSDGAGLSDAIFLCHVHRATVARDETALATAAELAAAFVPSRERQLETLSQGRAFLEIAGKAWGCEALGWFSSVWTGDVAYPIAVGVTGAGHRVALHPLLHGYLHAQLANWISAGCRLIPLGQTDAQKVLAALEGELVKTAAKAETAGLDDIGSVTFRADLASMRHETQYTRLFRS
jgi:urease accessory protein